MKRNNQDILKQFLSVFADEILKDIQAFITDKFKMPSAIWIYAGNKDLYQIRARSLYYSYYPDFCVNIPESIINPSSYEKTYCYENSKEVILNQIRDWEKALAAHEVVTWSLNRCHLGISRIACPIVISNKICGVIMLGKFKQANDDQLIENRLSALFSSGYIHSFFGKDHLNITNKCRSDMEASVAQLPCPSLDNLNDIAIKLMEIIPLVNQQLYGILLTESPRKDSLIHGLSLLEDIQHDLSNIANSYNESWQVVGRVLDRTVRELNLTNARLYFSRSYNYESLSLEVAVPATPQNSFILSLPSQSDLDILRNNKSGIFLPAEEWISSYLNAHTMEVFGCKSALIFSDKYYAEKFLLLSFGLSGKELSELELLILRIIAQRIMNYSTNVNKLVEQAYLMIDTGHSLRRQFDYIDGALKKLEEYNILNRNLTGKNDKAAEIVQLAFDTLDTALVKLDHISCNYQAFAFLSDQPSFPTTDNATPSPILEKDIDLCNVVSQFKKLFSVELRADSKTIRFDNLLGDHCIICAVPVPLWTILSNLIDNAIKFSYNNTYIHVVLRKTPDTINLEISNRGVGIPVDEIPLITERFYKASYKDRNKEIEGQGVGLTITKSYVAKFFPGGSLNFRSRPSGKRSGTERFAGDDYITTASLTLPHHLLKRKEVL